MVTYESAGIHRTEEPGCPRGPRTWPPASWRSRSRIEEPALAENPERTAVDRKGDLHYYYFDTNDTK